MRDLTLALFWAFALPMSCLAPQVGVVFWMWDAILSPVELMYGFMASAPTNRIIALITLCSLAITKKRDIYYDKILFFLCMLAVVGSISYLFALSYSPGDDELYQKLLKEIVFVFAYSWLIVEKKWFGLTTFALVLAVSFLGVKEGLISILTVGGHKIVGSKALGDNNQLAAALVVTLPFVLFLRNYCVSRLVKLGLLAAASLNIVTVIMTFSRGGFIGLIVTGLLLIQGSRSKGRAILAATAVLISIYIFAPAAWFSRVDTIQTAAEDDSSFLGRVAAWKISILIAEDNPLFGGGPHAVQHASVWGRYLADFNKLDFIKTPYPGFFPKAAHSIFFEVLGDLGIAGFFTYAMLFWCCLRACKITRRECIGDPSYLWAADLSSAIRVSLYAYLVTGALLSIAYQELLFILFAMSTRLHRTASTKSQHDNMMHNKSLSNSMQGNYADTRL